MYRPNGSLSSKPWGRGLGLEREDELDDGGPDDGRGEAVARARLVDVIVCNMSSLGDVWPSGFGRKSVAVVEMIRRL